MYLHGYDFQTTRLIRAGVIPFTIKNNHLYFLLGIDRGTRELTDFGGGVKASESMVDAAYRELLEESCKLFYSDISKNDVTSSVAITNHVQNTAIFFVYIDSGWLQRAESEFNNYQRRLVGVKKYNELIGVKWVKEQDFEMIAFDKCNQCMWRRIQNILCENTNWTELRFSLILGPDLTRVIKQIASFNCLSKQRGTEKVNTSDRHSCSCLPDPLRQF